MKSETIDLRLLHYFVATANTLNFTSAAAKLGIPKSKLSKSIARLESELNLSLFERSSRVVRLTEAGRLLYRRAEVLIEESSHLLDDLRTMSNSTAGRLRLAASPALGRFLSEELFPRFLQQWPDISISLKLSYEYENLFQEGLDLAFRMGKNRDDSLIERQIGAGNRVLVASPEYLLSCAPIHQPSDLLKHKSIQIFEGDRPTWVLQRGEQTEQVNLNVAFQCADFVSLVNMIKGGNGIGHLPWFVVRDNIASGELIQILPQWQSPPLPISVVYRQGYNKPARLAELLKWIDQNTHLFQLCAPG
ncbi:LysR family transcriptional regulator [Alteromonas gilva]|uniref:LysR substrate-binding domain-containing protein n=1 Tax=Alteromonas gilva TaxID=2987522 RepID=A0ABT5L666_9ALTE|nr:LysR family transcriptional regulator [Alteromonas gilva]MDC8832363.1 LysR substrate-binding domain-containing protein [Alteromonas gilva]